MAFVTGDYALGKDTGIIDLILVGNINQAELDNLVRKVEKLIKRRIRSLTIDTKEFNSLKKELRPEKAIWLWGER